MGNYVVAQRFFASLRMTANELVILSEAKNLDTAPTHQIGTDSDVKNQLTSYKYRGNLLLIRWILYHKRIAVSSKLSFFSKV
jgi:hypothetical protein